MAVSEQRCAWWYALFVDDRSAPGIGGFTGSEEILLAEKATSTSDDKRNHHSVANLQGRHVPANLFHDAHELVAEDVALLCFRDLASIEVEVGSADGGGRHP